MKKTLLTILIFALVTGGIYLPLSYFFTPKPASADNSTANGGTFADADDAFSGCTNSGGNWVNPGNAGSSDNAYASYGGNFFDSNEVSDELQTSNYGFAIPANATINGIVVEIEKHAASGDLAIDYDLQLTKTAGIQTGDNKADTTTDWPATDPNSYVSYGGSNVLWGTTWTPAEINSNGFGVVFCGKSHADVNVNLNVDHIRITVYYTPSAPTINVSGHVYSDEGSTGLSNSRTISLRVNGSGTYSTTTVASTGQYDFTGISVASIGDVITVYLDGAPEQAVTVTRAASTSGSLTGLDLYQNRVILRYEDSGPITNANLDQFDNACNAGTGDSDIQFCVDSGNLTVSDGAKLIVWTGETFAPGGTVTTSSSSNGDLDIQSSATLSMGSNALTVGGNFTNNGTISAPAAGGFSLAGNFTNNGTYTNNSGTITFTGTATSTISGATTFNNFTATTSDKRLAFQSQSGGAPIFTFAGTVTITGIKDHPVTVRSDTTGTQWLAHFNNAQTISWARVRDSGCDSGTAEISAGSHSNNISNNGSCWDFVDKSGSGDPVGTNPTGGGPTYTGGGHGGDFNGPADPIGVFPTGGGPTQTGNAASGETVVSP